MAFSGQHGVISQKIAIFLFALMKYKLLLCWLLEVTPQHLCGEIGETGVASITMPGLGAGN
jgi:hypothetical protein